MKTLRKLLLILVFAAMAAPSAYGGEFVYIDILRMFADKTTLMVEFGNYRGQMALKISFGHGLSSKTVGIVFKEQADLKNGQKIAGALEKLAEILNDPKRRIFQVDREFASEIGLTFQEPVKADLIQ